MKMPRKEFVDRLARVAPALSGNDLIPILTHFCFAEDEVVAYNDQIGISAPCKVGFDGCAPGATMLALLNASRSTNIEFKVTGGETKNDPSELVIQAASSKLRLPLLDVADFDTVWRMPAPAKKMELPVDTKKFLAAVDCCMRSVSIDTSVPDQLGITMIPQGNDLLMFSTDNSTLSHARVGLKDRPTFKRVILSAHFCRELLTLADATKPLHLEVTDKHSLLVNKASTLFGKLIESEKPLNFPDTLNRHLPEGSENKFISIPTKLEMIIERACIVAAASIETVRTEVTVEGKEVFFDTVSSKNIEAHDTITLADKHDPVQLFVDPKLLKKGYGAFDKMLMTDACFIMSGQNTYFFVGS